MNPTKKLWILMVEDVPADAELIGDELRSAGIDFDAERVYERDKFIKALETFSPDVILCDYVLPSFHGAEALAIARNLAPDVPFVFVTGALGEERAVDLMKSGATDFVLKDRLARLPLCVERALEEVEEKRRRRQAEEDLRRAYAEQKTYTRLLEQSNRELQEFAHVASHDLQEPARKIQTFVDLLQTGYRESLDEKGRDYLERMRRSAGRMQELIRALLGYSRLASRLEPFAEIDLRGVAEEAVADLEVLIQGAGARVEVGELPAIEADAVQMRRLFQNLIENSIKYRGKEKPLVRVYAAESQGVGLCEIRVEDNGIGFDLRYLDKIFKPFQTLHGRSAPYEGTGMGLAICRRIVEGHGGSITASSEPGKGAVFLVTLPKKQSRPVIMP